MNFRVASTILLVSVGAAAAMQQGASPAQPGVPQGHPQIPMPKVGDNWPKARPEDVASVEAIVKAFYDVPAGAAGQQRDWARYLSLFVPDARLIAARPGADGTAGAMFLSVADYVEANRTYFEKGGFFDKEIARRTQTFGNMTHVWSTYESRRKAEDEKPYLRGINSLQILRDGDRYWIINAFWEYERPDNPLPEQYATSPKE